MEIGAKSDPAAAHRIMWGLEACSHAHIEELEARECFFHSRPIGRSLEGSDGERSGETDTSQGRAKETR